MKLSFHRQGEPPQPRITPLEYGQLLARRFSAVAGQVALIIRGPDPVGTDAAKEAMQAFEAIRIHLKQARGK